MRPELRTGLNSWAHKIWIVLLPIVLLTLTSECFGVETAVVTVHEQGESMADPNLAAEAAEPVAGDSEVADGNVTVDFKDADIRNVLRILSYKGGVNIVADQEVEGTVTMRLVDVPWEKALQVILKTYGLTYERDNNIIRVTTLAKLQREELVTQVFSLRYSKAEDTLASVQTMLTDRGRIQVDERTNRLIVSDVPSNLVKVQEVIDQIDQRTRQVLIESKIVETTLDDNERLGIDWTIKATAGGASRPITTPFNNYGRDRDMYPTVESTASQSVEEVNGVDTIRTEIETDFPLKGYILDPQNSLRLGQFPMAVASDFAFGTLDFTKFQAVLEILKSRSDTKIVSNPNIVTLDNQEAEVVVAQTFNIPLYERNPSTGSLEITDYEERQIGVTLKVTPHVNDAGDIVVNLEPTVSAFLQFDTIGEVTAPRFSTRKAVTQVMVRDGETIAIGGLISELTLDVEKKVPILGDLPVVGYLFKKIESGVDRTNLIFFVTTRLMDSGQGATIATAMNNVGDEPSTAAAPAP
ncbi:MAG: secretin and TonB N-terminal domain-containing protein [Candidatus Omnitrophica bacterium]|nr:secretin and TonB N-terminal domain-containing protein [Candidatus Omnitrophota bacterium]